MQVDFFGEFNISNENNGCSSRRDLDHGAEDERRGYNKPSRIKSSRDYLIMWCLYM